MWRRWRLRLYRRNSYCRWMPKMELFGAAGSRPLLAPPWPPSPSRPRTPFRPSMPPVTTPLPVDGCTVTTFDRFGDSRG